jgi:hypothetical protein
LTTISESSLIGTNTAHDEISRQENELRSSLEAVYATPDTYGWVLNPMLAFRAITTKVLRGIARGPAKSPSSSVFLESSI